MYNTLSLISIYGHLGCFQLFAFIYNTARGMLTSRALVNLSLLDEFLAVRLQNQKDVNINI